MSSTSSGPPLHSTMSGLGSAGIPLAWEGVCRGTTDNPGPTREPSTHGNETDMRQIEVAGPASVVAAAPAPHPGVLAGSFLEFEPVECSFAEYLVVGHGAIVSRGCGAVER
jgi:hypothetical protein